MKKWWIDTGWPWLKENWWVVLIFPLVALAYAGHRLFGIAQPAIDPLRDADGRASAEQAERTRALQAENTRLAAELARIQAEHAELLAGVETRLEKRVQELQDDPQKLRDFMLAAGRP